MVAEIIQLRPKQPLLAGYLRVGHNGQKRLQGMLASGKLQHRRFVMDASHLHEQTELLASFRKAEREVILDTNFAEMFFEGKFKSAIKSLPWANQDRPWMSDDFRASRNFDVAHAIAEFAIKHGVNAILSPSHFVSLADAGSVSNDYVLCESLRKELDRLGGKDIKLDFELSLTPKALHDYSVRQTLAANLHNLPIDNVWIRVENFGSKSTGSATREFIECVRDLHSITKPIVLDCAGGLVGLSALSFGATGGLCHGVGQKEKFDISGWKKPRTGGGNGGFIYVPDIDRYLDADQLNTFFEARGGKSKFGCNGADCCGDLQDMFDRRDEHFIIQRSKQLADLSAIPVEKRADYFLEKHVQKTVRAARAAASLKVTDVKLHEALVENKKRIQRLQDALVDLNDRSGASHSLVPHFRGGQSKISAILAG